MKKYLIVFILSLFSINHQIFAQIVITNQGATVSTILNSFIGNGLTVSNAVMNCPNNAYGTFAGGSSIGISNGVMLSTGNTVDITTPETNYLGYINGTVCNDPQLMALEPKAINDCCILEFDIVPQCTNLEIRFVFGSEEYPAWVNQGFNDAFGFFISGQNPLGGLYANRNIALINGTTICTIDNVNAGSNSNFYVNNTGGTALAFGGYTTAITSTISVVPCQSYHFKIAIADAGDAGYDSGVFVDFFQCANSLKTTIASTTATCGESNGTATVTATDGLAPYHYVWTPAPGGGQGTATATGLTAGTTYTVTVNDNYACITPKVNSVSITGTNSPAITSSNLTQSVCSGSPSTAMNFTANQAGTTYTWSTSPEAGISGLILSGNGPIPVQTLTNATNAAISVSYSVIPHNNGCDGQAVNYVITVMPLPTGIVSFPAVNCYGTAVPLSFQGSPNSQISYSLNGAAVQTVQLGGSGTFSVNTASLLQSSTLSLLSIQYLGANTCNNLLTDSQIILILPELKAAISAVSPICQGAKSQVNFEGTSNATVKYQVNGGAQQFVQLNASGLFTLVTGNLESETQYKLLAIDLLNGASCHKDLQDAATISIISRNMIQNTDSLRTICTGERVSFVPNSIYASTDFSWSQSATIANSGLVSSSSGVGYIDEVIFNPTEEVMTANYIVQPSFQGCLGVPYKIRVTINPKLNSGFSFGSFCEGQPVIPSEIKNQGGVFSLVTIPSAGETVNATSGELSNGRPDVAYQIKYTVGICPSSTIQEVKIIANPQKPIVSGKNDFCIGDDITAMQIVNPTGSYSWYSDPECTILLGTDTALTVSNTLGTHHFFVLNEQSNCRSEIASFAIVIDICELHIPTAFTPDLDQINDTWYIEHLDEYFPKNKVLIYNRWGNLIYESKQGQYNSFPWDGKYNGEILPNSSFYYTIELNDKKEEKRSGTVTVIRKGS